MRPERFDVSHVLSHPLSEEPSDLVERARARKRLSIHRLRVASHRSFMHTDGTVALVDRDRRPVPFEVFEQGTYLHGTKAQLVAGDLLMPGRGSNFEKGRTMTFVYFTATLDAATWGAELAAGEGPGRIYLVEPTGEFEDDPNVTDKRHPGNPTQSFRSRGPLRVVGELISWVGHRPDQLAGMRSRLDQVGSGHIED